MYPSYEDSKEGRALEALDHPHGEDYPGAFDCYRKDLEDLGWSKQEIELRFGSFRNEGGK